MNIETRETRDEKDITPEEKATKLWIPVRRKYVKKQPVSDVDHARILAAHERNLRRADSRRKSFQPNAESNS